MPIRAPRPLAPWRALCVTGAVTLLLLLPIPASFAELGRGELLEVGGDKLAHFALFVPLAWSWLNAAWSRGASRALFAALFVALLAWGGAIELVQDWSGWRRGEWGDLVADALGVAFGFAGHRFRERRAARSGAAPDAPL